MKYIVIIGDGMADRPLKELGGLTPLKRALSPGMDRLATEGIIGMVRTIPKGFHPGSDVANLSILGYDPVKYYTGRAPLEAASIGVRLGRDDVAYRCNLVTLSFSNDKTRAVMDDYSGGHITTGEARELIKAISDKLGGEEIAFYSGVGYRHLMVWKNGKVNIRCVPPHDIPEKETEGYLPEGDGDDIIRDLMRRSVDILEGHPVNMERIKKGKKPANSIWFWGQGRRLQIPTYQERYGLKGALISAVDLSKGLGIYAGLEILNVPGITDWLDTNYTNKIEYTLNALKDVDYIYIHVAAPDEAGHAGNYHDKIKVIEDIDALLVVPLIKKLEARFKDYRLLLMPDHATPVEIKTHTEEPVPFVIYDSHSKKRNEGAMFDESIAERRDILVLEEGYRLMDYFTKETLN